ncbi:carbohydrate kinase family protein [Roseiflexus sp.]|uniref:carbohydrate kinase family protein n=1 Tax=Roseiflexus sp. TaxID=2562120 RepID=UPI00398B688C
MIIMAVGDLVWDVLVRPDGLLLPGGDTTGSIKLAPGGSAANVAAWIARCGAPAGFIGAVGADVFGDLITADLRQEGVEAHIIRLQHSETGVVLALIDRAGQRSMVTNRGADHQLLPEMLPDDILHTCRHVHLTGWSLFSDPPRAAAVRAAQIASASGATISFDPASYQIIREIGHDQFDRITADLTVDILFPNRDEGIALTGKHDPPAIAAALRERFPGALVALKLDRDGCFIMNHTLAMHVPGQAIDAPVDTTGAGDAFNGAFLAHYLTTGDALAAARLANRIGAWVAQRTGARPPIDDELRQILQKPAI